MVRRLPGSKLPEGRRRSAEFAGELTKACADHAKAIDRAIARDNALAEAFSLPVTPAYVVGHAVYRGSLDKKGMKGRDCGGRGGRNDTCSGGRVEQHAALVSFGQLEMIDPSICRSKATYPPGQIRSWLSPIGIDVTCFPMLYNGLSACCVAASHIRTLSRGGKWSIPTMRDGGKGVRVLALLPGPGSSRPSPSKAARRAGPEKTDIKGGRIREWT